MAVLVPVALGKLNTPVSDRAPGLLATIGVLATPIRSLRTTTAPAATSAAGV